VNVGHPGIAFGIGPNAGRVLVWYSRDVHGRSRERQHMTRYARGSMPAISEHETLRPLPDSVRLQRAYDDPQSDDGHRVLVDRVWPRGRTKADLHLDAWLRDLGPSTALRKWFGHDPDRWNEFQTRYRAELADPERARALDELARIARTRRITIVYGARDREHNQAHVIASEIVRRLERRS
jgi:uncharacterized protein YeaO (DUF488 family)